MTSSSYSFALNTYSEVRNIP